MQILKRGLVCTEHKLKITVFSFLHNHGQSGLTTPGQANYTAHSRSLCCYDPEGQQGSTRFFQRRHKRAMQDSNETSTRAEMFGQYCLFGAIHNSWTKLSQSLVVDIFLVIILNYLNMVYTCLLGYTVAATHFSKSFSW